MRTAARHRVAGAVLAAVLAAVLGTVPVLGYTPVAPAAADVQGAGASCFDPDPGQPVIATLPWAQRWLDVSRVWPFTRGRGVLVAVVDSGVDATHPQLSGAVGAGVDLVQGGPGTTDCVSHGTAVASVIAARPAAGVGFVGVAPDARILPVRISENDPDDGGQNLSVSALAQGIRTSADAGARVINLSVVVYRDYPEVRAAVRYAQSRGALLVAAAGNAHSDKTSGQGADPIPYPAAYPGVLGVGSIQVDGHRVSDSPLGPYVDLVAPGSAVLAATRQHGHRYWNGTSFAAAFVSGSAALLRSARPTWSAAQVTRQLLATATPAPAGGGYGHGVVDPCAAVVDTVSGNAPVALPRMSPAPDDEARAMRTAEHAHAAAGAHRIAGVAGATALLALVLAAVLTLGRRRGWRVGTAPAPVSAPSEPPDTTQLLPYRNRRAPT